MTAKRVVSGIRVGLLLLGFWGLSTGASAQSLFSGASQPVAMFDGGNGPLLHAPRGAMVAAGVTPMVEARALALTDVAGLASRRAHRNPVFAPFGGYTPPSAKALRREAEALRNRPPRDFSGQTDLICIAVSIYHEARNQPRDGQAAVASVILNRAANPDRWGRTPCEVVAPVQFSYLRPDRGFARIRNMRSWNEAVEIAAEVLLRGPDPTLNGADHYHATYVDPSWNRAMDRVVRIDDHIFWKSRPKPPGTG